MGRAVKGGSVSKEAIANLRARADRYRQMAGDKGAVNSQFLWEAAGDLYTALKLLDDAMSAPEERAAWDRYAAAALTAEVRDDSGEDGAGWVIIDGAAKYADAMLNERRKRFHGGAPC